MNIIKFKEDLYGGSNTSKDIYNNFFRGRYCYAIHMKYVLLMKPDDDDYSYYKLVEDDDVSNYVLLSMTDVDDAIKNSAAEFEYIPSKTQYRVTEGISSVIDYIKVCINGITRDQYNEYERMSDEDIENLINTNNIKSLNYNDWTTNIDKSNSPLFVNIEYFIKKNADVNGMADIPPYLLRRYRSQVAAIIYNGVISDDMPLSDLCEKKITLLKYYLNDMENETIDMIKLMQTSGTTSSSSSCGCNNGINVSTSSSSLSSTSTSCSCGCGSSTGLSTISSLSLSVSQCDVLKEYRSMMKLYMMQTFGDVDFWRYIAEKYPVAIDKIMDYTNALVSSGLSIFNTSSKLDLNYGCSLASSSTDSRTSAYLSDMQKVAQAFQYMLDGKWTEKSSYITSAMSTFALYYEYLQWNGYTVSVFEENWE